MGGIVDAWNAANPNAPVTHRGISDTEFATAIRTGMSGDQPPDVLQYEGYRDTTDFAAAGQLADLTDWWNQHKDKFILPVNAESACTYQGKVYCIPLAFTDGSELFYNPTILAANGVSVPKTYEEFLAASATLKAAGVTPIALGAKEGWPAMQWFGNFLVQRCGVDTVMSAVRQGGAKWTDECFVQSAQDLANLASQSYLSAGVGSDDYSAMTAVFASGKAAFMHTGTWYLGSLKAAPAPFEVGVTPFPVSTSAAHSDQMQGQFLRVVGIPAKGKNLQGGMALLDFLFSDQGTSKWAGAGNFAAVGAAVASAGLSPAQQAVWTRITTVKQALPFLDSLLPDSIAYDLLYHGATAVATGQMSATEYTQKLQEQMAAAVKPS